MNTVAEVRPPVPPFTLETATQKVRMAEDGWNSRDPQRVSLVYTVDSQWRNRAEFPRGREQIIEFLTRKWAKELDYRLIKELWAFTDNRIAVRFAYEWHDEAGNWFRAYGNENCRNLFTLKNRPAFIVHGCFYPGYGHFDCGGAGQNLLVVHGMQNAFGIVAQFFGNNLKHDAFRDFLIFHCRTNHPAGVGNKIRNT